MKRILMILLCCLLLTACSQKQPAPTQAPTVPPVTDVPTETPATPGTETPTATPTEALSEVPTEASDVVRFTIYTPNENADGFYETLIVINELTAQNVVDELIKENVLNEDIAVNSERLDGTQLVLDFNSAFRDQLVTYGTAGEQMMIGSVVNTFLSAYGVESIMITVDGQILESGHVIYDFPLQFMQ